VKNNVATRIFLTLNPWQGFRENSSALSCWATSFDIGDHSNIKAQLSIYRKLGLLTDQVAHLRNQLAEMGRSASVYEPPLAKIESAISPLLIAHQCIHVKQHLTADVFMALQMIGDFLPDEEESISEEDFRALVSLIHDLELTLQDSEVPGTLAALIRSHISIAETAISDYPLRGSSALKEAVKYAVGDIKMSPSFASEADTQTREAISSVWVKMNQLADKAIKAEGLVQIGERLTRFLEKLGD
jgi:hypothetical protein